MQSSARFVEPPKARAFDVVCAGEALWSVGVPEEGAPVKVRAGGGTVSTALSLARQGLRVGLATILENDSFGRALRERLSAAGVDVGGVELSRPTSSLLFVRGGARQVVAHRAEDQPISVPDAWSSEVLLLSGMSPLVSHGAALCKAARAARRAGTIVVVDVNVRWDLWAGRDPRSILMILREADVVWASAEDLFGLNMDVSTMRAALRKNAVLALSDGAGAALASGPFGELAPAHAHKTGLAPIGDDGAFVTSICLELARAGKAHAGGAELWARALQRGYDLARAGKSR